MFRSLRFRLTRSMSITGIFFPTLIAVSLAQPIVVSVRQLPLDPAGEWAAPKFSPDGRRIYFSIVGFAGIWEYDRTSTRVRTITADPGAGYGFVFSEDGKSIAYRKTVSDQSTRRRRQEIVAQNLQTGASRVAGTGADLSLPAFKGGSLLFVSPRGLELGPASVPAGTTVIGIEDTKIAIVRGGVKSLLDPMGNGSYVWPSLAPDGSTILAVEAQRGAFLCTVGGSLQKTLGRLDAPTWTRDGQWIVYMEARDDGERMVSSHIAAVASDGSTAVRLTDDPVRIDLDPQCSPADDAIVFSTETGQIFLLEYREGRR